MIYVILILLYTGTVLDTLHLHEAYRLAEERHPMQESFVAHDRINERKIQNLNIGYLPDVTFSSGAQYQSDVMRIDLPLPGAAAPAQPHDRYSVSLQIEQMLYDGGRISVGKEVQRIVAALDKQSVTVDLYELRKQVADAFFTVLLLREQLATVDLLEEELQTRLHQVEVQINGGILLPSNRDALEAEVIGARQNRVELGSLLRSALQALGRLLHTDLDEHVVLAAPQYASDGLNTGNGSRPEHRLFDLSRESLAASRRMVESALRPTVGIFGQGAYDRPGLNLFDDSFQPYFIAGINVRWKPWDWRSARREREVLDLQRELVDREEEAFTLQQEIAVQQELDEIERYYELMQLDDEVIDLRAGVVRSYESQLDEGVITAVEYVSVVSAVHQARLAKNIHVYRLARSRARLALLEGVVP